jgi:hypothetical protein
MFVHFGMANLVLLLQRLMVLVVGVFVTGFVMRPLNTPETTLQRGSPATLTLVTTIKRHDAQEDGAFSEVSTESAPERVPSARFVVCAGDLQEPMPNCDHDTP